MNSTSHFSSPAMVPRSPTPEESGPTEIPVLRGICETEPGGPPRTGLVDIQGELDKGEKHNTARS